MIKRLIFIIFIFLCGSVAGWLLTKIPSAPSELLSPQIQKIIPKPLIKYSFGELRVHQFLPKSIELAQPIATESAYTSWLFKFDTDEGWVSGQTNLPNVKTQSSNIKNSEKQFPVVVMIRGYVDKEEYKTGIGTKNAAAVFAKNGYITVAPDFLGYGNSDPESGDDIESRLVRPATVLQLLASLQNIPQVNTSRIFFWAHSNGGQIALSILEITGEKIPTTLWAPVSTPFPYSVLYYTNETDDGGKYLRKIISNFEGLYDIDQFSISNYWTWIRAPVQIHQGTADNAVPKEWSDQLVKMLKDQKQDVTYFIYPGADHNLKQSWNTVINRDVEFFNSKRSK